MASLKISNVQMGIQSLHPDTPYAPVDMVVFSLGTNKAAIFASNDIKLAIERSPFPIGVEVHEWEDSHEFDVENGANSCFLTMSAYKKRPDHISFDGLAHQGSHVVPVPTLISKIFEEGNNKSVLTSTVNYGATQSSDDDKRENFSYKFKASINFTHVDLEKHPTMKSQFSRTEFHKPGADMPPYTLVLTPENMSDEPYKALAKVCDNNHAIQQEIETNLKTVSTLCSKNTDLYKHKKINELSSSQMDSFMSSIFMRERLNIHSPFVTGLVEEPITFHSVCYDKVINAAVKDRSCATNGAQQLALAISHCGNWPEIKEALTVLNSESIYVASPPDGHINLDAKYSSSTKCCCSCATGCNLPKIKALIDENPNTPCIQAMECLRDLHRHAIGMAPMLQGLGKYSSDMTCLGNMPVEASKGNTTMAEIWMPGEDMAHPGHLLQSFSFKFNTKAEGCNPVEFHSSCGNDDCESLTSIARLSSESVFAFGERPSEVHRSVFEKIDTSVKNNIIWAAETMAKYRNHIIVDNCFGLTTSPSANGKECSFDSLDMNCQESTAKYFKTMKKNAKARRVKESNAKDPPHTYTGTKSEELGGHSFSLAAVKLCGGSVKTRYLFSFGEHTGCVLPVHCSESVNVQTVHPFSPTSTIPVLSSSNKNGKFFDTSLAEISFRGLPQTFCQIFKSQLSFNANENISTQHMMIMNCDENIVGGPNVFYRSVVLWKNFGFFSWDTETKTLKPGVSLHKLVNVREGVPVIPASDLKCSTKIPEESVFMVPLYDENSLSAKDYSDAWKVVQSSMGQAEIPKDFQEHLYLQHFPQLQTKHFKVAEGYRGMFSFASDNSSHFDALTNQKLEELKNNWKGLSMETVANVDVLHGDGVFNQKIVFTTIKNNEKHQHLRFKSSVM